MAEQVRFRRSNMQFRIPEVRFAAQAEAARGAGQIANSLDRLSNFFLSMSEQRAKIEGAEYGAENAPTAKQIEDAFTTGDEIDVVGDDRTVFGRSARKAALSIAGDEITSLATQRANELSQIFEQSLTTVGETKEFQDLAKQQYNLNDLSPATFADKLNEVSAGYGAVLDETSPALARKFRAEMGISNNSAYVSFLGKFVEKQDKILESNARISHQQIFSVDSISSKMRTETGVEVIDNLKSQQIGKFVSFNTGSEHKTFADNMDSIIKQSALKILDDDVLAKSNPSKLIKQIQKGSFDDLTQGAKNAVTFLKRQGMSNTDIAKDLRDERQEQLAFIENEQEGQNTRTEKDEKLIKASIMDAMSNGNKEQFDIGIQSLKATDPETAQKFIDEFNKAGGRRTSSDPEALSFLRMRGPALTFQDVEDRLEDLNNDDIKKFRDEADKQESAEMQRALSVIRGELNLPPEIQNIATGDKNYKRVALLGKIKGRLDAKYDEARREGLSFDGQAEADAALEELGTEFTDAINTATIRQAEQVISSTNLYLTDDEKVDSNDYGRMIAILKSMKADKNKRPAALRNQNDVGFAAQIKALEDAMELN